MSVITVSEKEYQEKRHHLLVDIECGALVTGLVVAGALYTGNIAMMLFAGVFVIAELDKAYDFFKLCRSHKK